LEPATEHILIVDSARMGEAPGAVRFFKADEVETKKELTGLTTHESDLLKILELARMTGHHIPPITFMGIEPASTENRMGLSAIIEQRLAEYVTKAIARCLAA
jgi:hydrogenase maturation protease